MDKDKYLGELRRSYVALWISRGVDKIWPLLTDQELVSMVNILSGAKSRVKKEKKNAIH